MRHTDAEEKLTVVIPQDCAWLIKELVQKLGGVILEEEEEIVVVPPPPAPEWPGRMCKGMRCRINLSQQQLADALGVPVEHVMEYENFTREIPLDKAHGLAKILGCTPQDFMANQNGEENAP